MTATVLIADDNKQIRQAFRRLLTAIPKVAVVAEARDGEEAVRLALEHRPSVVLMDISMPNMDGVEATRRIRATAPDIRVVVAALDDLRAELEARGATVKDGHWGCRLLVVEDLDGNQLYFSYPKET